MPQSIFYALKDRHIPILAFNMHCVDKWTLFHPEISSSRVKSIPLGIFHLAKHLLQPKIDRFALQNLLMYDFFTGIYAHWGIQTRPRRGAST